MPAVSQSGHKNKLATFTAAISFTAISLNYREMASKRQPFQELSALTVTDARPHSAIFLPWHLIYSTLALKMTTSPGIIFRCQLQKDSPVVG